VRAAFFAGGGLFLARSMGPGRVVLQTLPFPRLASRIIAAAPRVGGEQRGVGGVPGALGGVLDGDDR
jgi:uncharacterized protein (AIM24 family)